LRKMGTEKLAEKGEKCAKEDGHAEGRWFELLIEGGGKKKS